VNPGFDPIEYRYRADFSVTSPCARGEFQRRAVFDKLQDRLGRFLRSNLSGFVSEFRLAVNANEHHVTIGEHAPVASGPPDADIRMWAGNYFQVMRIPLS